MRNRASISLVAILLLFHLTGVGQDDMTGNEAYQEHLEQAQLYLDISSYENAIAAYKQAIDLALENKWTEQAIETQITLAEVLRKAHQYRQGLEILNELKHTEQFPLLHTRKLGRIAAIIHEEPSELDQAELDTIQLVLRQALVIAQEHDFELEEASLRREMGYLQFRHNKHSEGIQNLEVAAELYRVHEDKQNYAGTLTKLIECHVWYQRYEKADSISALALAAIEGKDWYATEVDLYGTLVFQMRQLGDTNTMNYWATKSAQSHMDFQGNVYSTAMSAYKVLYETEKFRVQAEESATIARMKSEELERQEQRMRELIILLTLLGLAVVATIVLFLRERGLKARLKVVNENYQMLNVESNHRIKNNLQMVTSLLKYAKKGQQAGAPISLDEISNKIQTVSALHKHLHLDAHNDFVNLGTYFQEIIHLYQGIASERFEVNDSIHQIKLRSERIVYFGLLFNEMLANSLEHNKANQLRVVLDVTQTADGYSFVYEDDSTRDGAGQRGTGSVLIEQLIKRVEGANYTFNPATGRYQFDFYD